MVDVDKDEAGLTLKVVADTPPPPRKKPAKKRVKTRAH